MKNRFVVKTSVKSIYLLLSCILILSSCRRAKRLNNSSISGGGSVSNAAFSGFVFEDIGAEGDLRQPGTDIDFSGIILNANCVDGHTASTTTNSAGYYEFNNIPVSSFQNNCQVSVDTATLPPGVTFKSSGDCNGAVAANGGAAACDEVIDNVVLNPGDNKPEHNFGYVDPLGSISGCVFQDSDNGALAGLSGIYNNRSGTGSDVSLSGAVLSIAVNGSGALPSGYVVTQTIDANGCYRFGGLPLGQTYDVSVTTPPSGYTSADQKFDNDGSGDEMISLIAIGSPNPDDQITQDFGYNSVVTPPPPPATASIAGCVFIDDDNGVDNSLYQAGTDTPVAGITVDLLDASNAVIATQSTAVQSTYTSRETENGCYHFTGLTVGAGYKVQVTNTGGTPSITGMNHYYDPEGNASPNNESNLITTVAGLNSHYDFGYNNAPAAPTGSIAGCVYIDKDFGAGNKEYKDGNTVDTAVSGVTIELYISGTLSTTQVTGTKSTYTGRTTETGCYHFTNIPTGSSVEVKVLGSSLSSGSTDLSTYTHTFDDDNGSTSPNGESGSVTIATATLFSHYDFGYNKLTPPQITELSTDGSTDCTPDFTATPDTSYNAGSGFKLGDVVSLHGDNACSTTAIDSETLAAGAATVTLTQSTAQTVGTAVSYWVKHQVVGTTISACSQVAATNQTQDYTCTGPITPLVCAGTDSVSLDSFIQNKCNATDPEEICESEFEVKGTCDCTAGGTPNVTLAYTGVFNATGSRLNATTALCESDKTWSLTINVEDKVNDFNDRGIGGYQLVLALQVIAILI